MTQLMGDALAVTNVILASIVAINQWAGIKACLKDARPCWLKLLFFILALYWAALYTFVFLAQPGVYDPVWFGQVFVRPAFTLTLGAMAAAAIERARI